MQKVGAQLWVGRWATGQLAVPAPVPTQLESCADCGLGRSGTLREPQWRRARGCLRSSNFITRNWLIEWQLQ